MSDDAPQHVAHDLERLVAFADRELDAADTRLATDQIADCDDCARLVDDLRVLATADRALATPPRPRDFRLTPADAERLTVGHEEPVAAMRRLTEEMPAARPQAANHAAHDALLIAASLDAGLSAEQRRTADEWIATCTSCAELRADLVAIAAAHRALPTPSRPRDLRLTERDAARFRGGRWRDLIGWIGGTRDGITRPLAAGLTALGLVGVLVTGGPGLLASSGATAGAAPAQELQAVGSSKHGTETDPEDSVVFTGEDPGTVAPLGSNGAAQNADGSALPAPVASGPSADPASSEAGVDSGSSFRAGSVDRGTQIPDRLSAVPGDDAQRDIDGTSASTPVGLMASIGAVLAGLAVFVTRRITRSLRDV